MITSERSEGGFFLRFPLKTLNFCQYSLLVNHILIDATYSFICHTENNHDLSRVTRSLAVFINYNERAERARIFFGGIRLKTLNSCQ